MNTVKGYPLWWESSIRCVIALESSIESRIDDIVAFFDLINKHSRLSHLAANEREFSTPYSTDNIRQLWGMRNERMELRASSLGSNEFYAYSSWERDYCAQFDYLGLEISECTYSDKLWFGVFNEIWEFARCRFKVVNLNVFSKRQLKSGSLRTLGYTGQMGLKGIHYIEGFGPKYVRLLPAGFEKLCSKHSDVYLQRYSDGSVLIRFGDSASKPYWELEGYKAISALLEPMLIRNVPLNMEYNPCSCDNAPVLPVFDFSEMRKGYEQIPELLARNSEIAVRTLLAFMGDVTPLARMFQGIETHEKGDHIIALTRFTWNVEQIWIAFQKQKLVRGLTGKLESLDCLPQLFAPIWQAASNDESTKRQLIVGLASYIAQVYIDCVDGGRSLLINDSPVIKYSGERGRIGYVPMFLEAVRILDQAV